VKKDLHRKATHVTKLYVGLKRQLDPTTARCQRAPRKVTATRVDDFFFAERRRQGVPKAGATRYSAKGLWMGNRERTAVYEVQWFPGGKETYPEFRRHMNRLAQNIARRFCQDAVLVVHRTPSAKTSAFFSPRTRRAARRVAG